jgi:hypothetical protein
LDRQRDDPQRDTADAIDERDDEDQAGSARAVFDAAQAELYASLVLLEDANRPSRSSEQNDYHCDDCIGHGRGEDPVALLGDRAGELDERCQSAATRPRQPTVE